STPARIDVAKAISAVEKFLGFRDNPVPLSEDSSITINGEFISILEFETMPPSAWASIWGRCGKNAAHRELLYALLQKYVSVYSTSNLFGILALHDYEEFSSRTNRRLVKLRLRDIVLEGASFQAWNMEECEIKDCRFTRCSLAGTRLRDCQLV